MAFIRAVKELTKEGQLFPMGMFNFGIVQGNYISFSQSAFWAFLQPGKPSIGELKPLE
jgi:hypothetical protein